MKKIEQKMVRSIYDRKEMGVGNTTVLPIDDETVEVSLFGNHIADVYYPRGIVDDSHVVVLNKPVINAHPTKTTVSRLQALGVPISRSSSRVIIRGVSSEPEYVRPGDVFKRTVNGEAREHFMLCFVSPRRYCLVELSSGMTAKNAQYSRSSYSGSIPAAWIDMHGSMANEWDDMHSRSKFVRVGRLGLKE